MECATARHRAWNQHNKQKASMEKSSGTPRALQRHISVTDTAHESSIWANQKYQHGIQTALFHIAVLLGNRTHLHQIAMYYPRSCNSNSVARKPRGLLWKLSGRARNDLLKYSINQLADEIRNFPMLGGCEGIRSYHRNIA